MEKMVAKKAPRKLTHQEPAFLFSIYKQRLNKI
jgi:hypothetical protein